MNKKYLKLSAATFILLLLLACVLVYWRNNVLHPSTDDAYVEANVINIAAQVSGPVSAVYVNNYQSVKKDQPLFNILPDLYQAVLNKTEAEKIKATKNASRVEKLFKSGHIAQSMNDEAQADATVAEAAFEQARLNLKFTQITAPADGTLINFDLRVGSSVAQGVPLFAVVEDHAWWVEANYKETQLERMRAGQSAIIVLDMYPQKKFHGHLVEISRGSGNAFALLPAENANGNWIKVTQRFPVKIMIDDPDPRYPLRIGASVTVTVDTTQ